MFDALGDRMKDQYENRTRYLLPRRTYTIIRVDGKAFHTFTRDCKRPYDENLMQVMDETARNMCMQIESAKLAYVQSDEISILLTDFATDQTQAWFDGNIQKLCSISASIATAEFNRLWYLYKINGLEGHRRTSPFENTDLDGAAYFDSRVFTIPDPIEVVNYFVWRQQDAVRNSIQMAGQACFSHKELDGVSCDALQEKLFQEKAINWSDYPAGCKRGRCVIREKKIGPVVYTDKRTNLQCSTPAVERNVWSIVDPPIFTKDKEWLANKIPLVAL